MANKKNIQGSNISFDKAALIDALLVIIVMIAVKRLLLPYSLQFAGPASTLCAMIVATWRLRLRGLTWADLGFRRPESISKTLLLTIAANEAEREVPGIILVDTEIIGASGRIFMSGKIQDLKKAQKTIDRVLKSVTGRTA